MTQSVSASACSVQPCPSLADSDSPLSSPRIGDGCPCEGGASLVTEGHARGAATSRALRNLRGVAILLLVVLHSTMPYVAFLKSSPSDFATPPYAWVAFPIVDSRRWLGFDLIDAWIDVHLMSLMFLLSGLFTWPSLTGKGGRAYLLKRLTRLGAPFVLALFVLMPIALYPAYRVTAIAPSLAGYAQAYLSLPFWPSGPMWFLWMLLAFTMLPTLIRLYTPGWASFLARLSSGAGRAPGRYFLGLATAATLAYVPLALAFSPWDWTNRGPISFQQSRPLLYAVFYLAGCGIGAHGLADGLLAESGRLANGWRLWLLAAFASLAAWMGLTGLALSYPNAAPLWAEVLSNISYAGADASSVFFMLAASLRLRALRWRWLDAVSKNAFGIYILHYTPLVWLQYALLDFPAPAVVKAPLAFGGTLLAALAGATAFRWVLRGVRLSGAAAVGA